MMYTGIEGSVVTCPADMDISSPIVRDDSNKAVFRGLQPSGDEFADDASLPTRITFDMPYRSDSSSSLSSMEDEDEEEDYHEDVTLTKSNKTAKKRVRFAMPESSIVTTSIKTPQSSSIGKKRGRIADNANDVDSNKWWSREELEDIHQSFVFAVKTREHNMPAGDEEEKEVLQEEEDVLDQFSSRSRKRRKLVRSQMKSTIEAVRSFEAATSSKAPPEMLSRLLERYSAPMAQVALENARTLEAAQAKKATTAVAKVNSLYSHPAAATEQKKTFRAPPPRRASFVHHATTTMKAKAFSAPRRCSSGILLAPGRRDSGTIPRAA